MVSIGAEHVDYTLSFNDCSPCLDSGLLVQFNLSSFGMAMALMYELRNFPPPDHIVAGRKNIPS